MDISITLIGLEAKLKQLYLQVFAGQQGRLNGYSIVNALEYLYYFAFYISVIVQSFHVQIYYILVNMIFIFNSTL